jgi:hypothetical protein
MKLLERRHNTAGQIAIDPQADRAQFPQNRRRPPDIRLARSRPDGMIQALAGGLEISQNGASATDTGPLEALEKSLLPAATSPGC